jgi:hypothetical protein
MEIKLKRSYVDTAGVQVESITIKGRIMLCDYKGKEYLILGKCSQMKKGESKILRTIFGDEVVYTKQQVLVPRSFFFI